jgi:acyl-CoA synthetase (AMP-forming)/AMP-acid ligase II
LSLTIRPVSASEHNTILKLLTLADPDGLAIADEHRDGLTYRMLRDLMGDTHRFLTEIGIAPCDTLAISLRNGPETAALFLSLASYCRVAPLNPNYTSSEVEFALRDLNAVALVSTTRDSGAVEAARQLGIGLIWLDPAGNLCPGEYELETDFHKTGPASESSRPSPDDIALLLHTSGTTARPKLVPLTHRNLCLSARSVASVLQLTAQDRCLSVMPLFHIHGLVGGLLASISAGAGVCCPQGFQATSFFGWLDSSQATWYTAVPTMHQAILARARHNSDVLARHKLRLIRSSSSPLYPAIWEQLEATFGVPVLNAYGMTEAAHQIASVPLPGGSKFRTTVGSAAGPQAAIMDDAGRLLPAGQIGEVVLRGEQIMSGYLQPEEANHSAFSSGWFRTGDEGFLDSDGVLTLTGRIKEMINSGGEKISPYEVEEALLLHPATAQAVAFAIPHPLLGEAVAAAVVLREDCTASERELLQAAGQRLARHKVPRRLFLLDAIPQGATGKLQRIGLAARLGVTSSGND